MSLSYSFSTNKVIAGEVEVLNVTSSGNQTFAPTGDVILNPSGSDVTLSAGVNLTYNGGTQFLDSSGVVTNCTQLNVDNIRIDGNTISSTNDGNIILSPNTDRCVEFATELCIYNAASDPSANLTNGMLYYNSTSHAIKVYANSSWTTLATSSATGDVVGPASATDEAVALFDGTTGKLLKNSDLIYTTASFQLNINNSAGDYRINGTSVLTGTTLGSGVVNSSLTSVGTLTALQVDNVNINANTISTTDTNGDLVLAPDGTGSVTTTATISAGALTADNITIDGNTISSTNLNGDVNVDPDGTGNLNLVSGGYQLAGTTVLSGTTLGSTIVTSSLTSVGTLTALQVDFINIDGNTISSTDVSNTGIILDPAGTGDIEILSGSIDVATGGDYQINNVSVLNATTLGSSVVTSSLTTVGALASGSIASGFGSINIGSNSIVAGQLDIDSTLRLDSGTISIQTGNTDLVLTPGATTGKVDVTNGNMNLASTYNYTINGTAIRDVTETLTNKTITGLANTISAVLSNQWIGGPVLQTSTTATDENMFVFVYAGTDNAPAITAIYAHAYSSEGVNGVTVKVRDFTNSLDICSATVTATSNANIQTLGTISNLPTGRAVFILQLNKSTSGTGYSSGILVN